jgi:hypothetical protein
MKLLLAIILSFSSFATLMDDPSIEINDFEIISSSFPSGSFDSTKLDLIINEVRGKQNAAFLGFCMSNLPEEATDNNYCLSVGKAELQKGWSSNLYNRTYQQILNLLNAATGIGRDMGNSDFSTKEGQVFLKKVSLALQIYENTKKGPLIPKDVKTFDYLGKLGSFFGLYSIKDPKDAPETPQELPKINKSLIWTNESNIVEDNSEEIDTVLDFNGSTNFPFVVNFRGEKWAIRFPTEVLDVPKNGDLLDGIKFKIRPNTPQVGHVLKRLARELGYNVVPSMFKKTVRIRFSQQDLEGSSFQLLKNKLLVKLSETYPQEILPKSIFDDSKDYIELKGIALEKIYDEENFLSFNGFPLSSGGNQYRKEYRALALFAAWVDLPFLDDNIGAGIFDVKNAKLLHLLYNLDYGLGYGYPNLFREKLVKKVHRKDGTVTKIDLHYKPFQKTDLFKKMNLSDARWMAEKISHIKPDFLKNIFLQSGFPETVAEIFVRKLMDRRNQILEAFDLINEQTPREEGWNKTLPGLEKYFNKDGYLIDPDEELTKLVESSFPIYWSTTWFAKIGNHGFNRVAFKNYGRRLLTTINSYAAGNLHLGPGYYNNAPVFQEFATNGNPGLGPCIGNCFFQGLNIGVHTLLPYRFVIENPDNQSKKRFLVIDLFRLALRLSLGSQFYNALGVSPAGLQPVVNVNTFAVFEFVKIHPTDDFKQYTQGYGEGMKIPGLPIFGLQQKFIESMEEDDSIMINKYIGFGSTVGAGWSAPIGVASANFGVDASVILLSGKTLHREIGDNVVLNFSKLTSKQVSLFARLEIAGFIDHNLFTSGPTLTLRDINKRDEVFLFNLKDEKDHEMLLESVKKITPKNIPDEYRVSERLIHSKNAEISTRLTSFMAHDRKTKKIEAQFKNFTDGTVQKELAYVRRLDTLLNQNQRIYDYKASLNEKGDLFLKVKTFIKFKNVKKEQFQKFYPMIEKLTPDDFIVFDLNAVDEDMGDIEFNSIAIISGEGIQKLLGFSNFQICKAYLEGEEEEEIECDKSNYPIGLKLLISDLEKTKKEFKELGPNPNKKSVFSVLKKLVNLQVHHYKNDSLIKLFKTLIPKEDFFQNSTLSSSRAAFPGKIDEINLSRNNKGSFTPTIRHLAESVEQAYAIFSDQLFYALRNHIYFRDPSIEYPRTGFMNKQL